MKTNVKTRAEGMRRRRRKKKRGEREIRKRQGSGGGGGGFSNFNENQFIVEGKNLPGHQVTSLPLSASLYPSFSIRLSPHSCYTTLQGPGGSDELQCPPRSSAEVVLLGSGWGR